MKDRDGLLLEAVGVHRRRLASALAFGPPRARRPLGDNVRRFIGSVVCAAVVCAVCVGVSFVSSVLAQQALEKAQQEEELRQQQQSVIEQPAPEPSVDPGVPVDQPAPADPDAPVDSPAPGPDDPAATEPPAALDADDDDERRAA